MLLQPNQRLGSNFCTCLMYRIFFATGNSIQQEIPVMILFGESEWLKILTKSLASESINQKAFV